MKDRTCSVPDCGGDVVARGCCDKHYRRLKRYGNPLLGPPSAAREHPPTCAVLSCGRPYAASGYCRRHYRRIRETGSLDRRVPAESRGIPRGAYVEVVRPGHPLAGRRNGAALHRVVLYDVIGPGSHPCHWCGSEVSWDAPRYSPQELQADHIDQDRSNNDAANLVPTCGPCNTSRSSTTRRV